MPLSKGAITLARVDELIGLTAESGSRKRGGARNLLDVPGIAELAASPVLQSLAEPALGPTIAVRERVDGAAGYGRGR